MLVSMSSVDILVALPPPSQPLQMPSISPLDTSNNVRVLKIRQPWLDLILAKRKCWDIRHSPTQLGLTLLYEVGEGRILGRADIMKTFPLTEEIFYCNKDKHCLSKEQLDKLGYNTPYVWVMGNVVRFASPIAHDGGRYRIIWGRQFSGNLPP